MIKIPISQEKEVIIDDEDYELVSQYKWYTRKARHTYYAVCHVYKNGKRTSLAMHQVLCPSPDKVDHKNGNGLDNRRGNLRACTKHQNDMNRHYTFGSSKYKGVSWNKRDKKWQATIKYNNVGKFLGYFTVEEEAAKAYDSAALEYFGEFASINGVL